MQANDKQVGGSHYKGGEQHWDRVRRMGLDYFQAQITKYVERCWRKDGLDDIKKAEHFIQKYIEILEAEAHTAKSMADSLRNASEQAEERALRKSIKYARGPKRRSK